MKGFSQGQGFRFKVGGQDYGQGFDQGLGYEILAG